MHEYELLRGFLSSVLVGKRERILGFIEKEKSRRKFLNMIYHDLESCLGGVGVVNEFSASTLAKPAVVFAPPSDFGSPVADLSELYDSRQDSFLAITTDGLGGLFRPETLIDSQVFFELAPKK